LSQKKPDSALQCYASKKGDGLGFLEKNCVDCGGIVTAKLTFKMLEG
jgi:hypothetical protein